MTLTQEISLDIYKAPEFAYINAKQGDNISRVLVATITADNKTLKPDHTRAQAVFRATKPDKTGVMYPAAIGEDGKITFALTDQVLAVPGDVAAEITIMEGDQVLTTATFYIQVARCQGGTDIPSENEFLFLLEATKKAEAAAAKANDAADFIKAVSIDARRVEAGGQPTVITNEVDGHLHLDLGLVTGDTGPQGEAATIEIGPVATGGPGSSAAVQNVGDKYNAILQFTVPQGPVGPAGGVDSVNGKTGIVTLSKEDVGLALVDNTADSDKEVASAGKVRNALTFTGAVNDSYDGSEAKSVNIPSRPSPAEMFLTAHPVGSYYWSNYATSPASLYGGTWEQIKDRFVLAAGDTYSAGDTGGAASVTHFHDAGNLRACVNMHSKEVHMKYGSNMGFTSNWYVGGSYGGTSAPFAFDSSTEVIGSSADTSVATMPPYIVAYCWRRTA